MNTSTLTPPPIVPETSTGLISTTLTTAEPNPSAVLAPSVSFAATADDVAFTSASSVVLMDGLPPLPNRSAIKTATETFPLEGEEGVDDPTLLMDPNHPLMERVQAALSKQLSAHLERLNLQLVESHDAERQAVYAREALGVDLYTCQQDLAKLQISQTQADDQMAMIKGYREEAERSLEHAKSRHAEQQQKLKDQRKNLEIHKQELDKLNLTLKQVDLYNEDLRSKILVAKRTTLKAEEDLVSQEMEKKRQDFFIDRITTRISELKDQRAMYEAQLVAQQKETSAAMETLQEASFEMDAIQFENRQLMQQWKSSMVGLQRRQDMLFQVHEGINKNNDTLIALNGEINGFKQSIRKAQEEGESLAQLQTKIEQEITSFKKLLVTTAEKTAKVQESYAMYMKTLQATEGDLEAAIRERNRLQQEYNLIVKQTEQVKKSTQGVEDAIEEKLHAQMSMEKGVVGTKRDGSRLRAVIYEKEALIAVTENVISSQKLETLMAQGRVQKLKETMKNLDDEAENSRKLIERGAVDSKKKSDELVKKLAETDLLNKKFEALSTSNSKEESMGPMEAIVHNLSKSVNEKERECVELSKFWLKSQNELISIAKSKRQVSDETQELNLRLTVLERKKAVIDNAFHTEEREIKGHQRNIKQIQYDMQKINALILKQVKFQGHLEENNLELEREFRAKLKNAELESIRLEQKIDQLRDEKERGLKGLVEAERQILLWEKKIQIARETQDALDPNVGATEIKEMQSEIHRMKLHYTNLLKTQERLVSEMERSVYRRESIAVKSKNKGKTVGQAALHKMIAELTKKVKQSLSDIAECDQDILTLKGAKENIISKTQDAQNSCETLRVQEDELMQKLERVLHKRQIENYLTLSYQRQQRRFQELSDSKYAPLVASEDAVDTEYNKAQARINKIDGLIVEILNSGQIGTKSAQDSLLSLKKFLKDGAAMTAC